MIQPVKSGAALIAEISSADVAAPALWWLGQSGFAIRWRNLAIYIDPYLSESLTAKYAATGRPHIRMTACPLDPSAIAHADLVLCTHKHSDHMDPGTLPALMAASPQAKLILPMAHAAHAEAMGIPRSRQIALRGGDSYRHAAGVGIHAIPSAHESLDDTEEFGYPHLGYVVRLGEYAIYHPGDCIPYDGLVEHLRPYRVSAALLPINGRDPARGVPGNFDVAGAAQLAEDIGADWLVPMHYDMFTFNTVDVGDFVTHMREAKPRQRFKVFECGEGWRVPAIP